MEHSMLRVDDAHQFFNLLLGNKDDESWKVYLDMATINNNNNNKEAEVENNNNKEEEENQLNVESSDPIFLHKENANKILAVLIDEYSPKKQLPMEPVQLPQFVEPVLLFGAFNPTEPIQLLESTKPDELFQLVDFPKPSEPIQFVDFTKPTEPVQLFNFTKTVEPVQPIDSTKPTKPSLPKSQKSTFKREHLFPTLVWNLVNDDNIGAIYWNESGETFRIKEPLFESQCLASGLLFKTKKISSFIRQLNLYGFRKFGKGRHVRTLFSDYQHPYFVRGRPDLVAKITRKQWPPLSY